MDEGPDGDEPQRVEQASRARQEPKHDEAETEIVRLGQRMQAGERIGEAQEPDRAGEKEERARADRGEAEKVERETHPSLALQRFGAVRLGAVDEGDRGEGREKRKAERDVLDAGDRRRRRDQEERSDAAGAEELDGHHPVEVAGSPQHPDEPDGDREQDEARRARRTSFIAERPHEESSPRAPDPARWAERHRGRE